MKLLFYIGNMKGGGAERVLANIVNELAKREHEIGLVTDTSIPFAYEVDERVKRINIHSDSYHRFDSVKGFNSLYHFLSLCRQIRKVAKQEKPDIAICFMYGLNMIVIPSLLGCGIKVVASEHTTFNRTVLPLSAIKYHGRIFANQLADRVTILTEYDKRYLKGKLDNTVVMPNPLSYPVISNHDYSETMERRNNILTCGSIDRYKMKGFDNLIIAFSKIADRYPNCCLDIAGTGNERDFMELKLIAQQHGVEHQINFLGFRKDIKELMMSHKLYVLSSKFEGFGMVLIEAMAMGCPCVSYDLIAGPNEIIKNGEDGLLVENQNIDKLAEAMDYMLSHEEERKEMAKNAMVNVKRFEVEKIVDKWEEMFFDLKTR